MCTSVVVVINGTFPDQKFLGFMLVAVTANAVDEATAMGTFQVEYLLTFLIYLILQNFSFIWCKRCHTFALIQETMKFGRG